MRPASTAVDPEGETEELAGLLERRGIPAELARQTAASLMTDPKVALKVHAKEELGLDPAELGSPWGAAGSSFVTFSAGALLPLAPFLLGSGAAAAWISVGVSLAALFGVGAVMTRFTGRPWALSGGRMTIIGGVAALITFLIGRLLGVTAL